MEQRSAKATYSDRRIVVIGATEAIAEVLYSLGCRPVFVQQPGEPVRNFVDLRAHLYSVDYLGAQFAGFVRSVLRPLSPHAVVSGEESGYESAKLATSLLGTDSEPIRLTGDPSSIRSQVELLLRSTPPRILPPAD